MNRFLLISVLLGILTVPATTVAQEKWASDMAKLLPQEASLNLRSDLQFSSDGAHMASQAFPDCGPTRSDTICCVALYTQEGSW